MEFIKKQEREFCKNCGREYDGSYPCSNCGSVNFIKKPKQKNKK